MKRKSFKPLDGKCAKLSCDAFWLTDFREQTAGWLVLFAAALSRWILCGQYCLLRRREELRYLFVAIVTSSHAGMFGVENALFECFLVFTSLFLTRVDTFHVCLHWVENSRLLAGITHCNTSNYKTSKVRRWKQHSRAIKSSHYGKFALLSFFTLVVLAKKSPRPSSVTTDARKSISRTGLFDFTDYRRIWEASEKHISITLAAH